MPLGYLIARSFIVNSAGFEQRRAIVARLMDNFGGRFLVRTLEVDVAVGEGGFGLSIVEFPSVTALEHTLMSPEIKALHADFEDGHAQVDLWGVPGIDVPAGVSPGEGPRGYLLARATVSGVRRIQRPSDLLSTTVAAAGGRILVRSGQIQLAASRVDVAWLTLIEMPTLLMLKAAMPVPGTAGADALYKSFNVQDLWIAPGVSG